MLATQSPLVQYFDTDGSPLDGGSVYFGVANQNPETSPVAVYWDAAGTQPAAQPIRTVNGYTVRSGSPAIVYTNDDYSLLVRDARGRQVLCAPNSADFGNAATVAGQVASLRADLANTSDAAKGDNLLGVKQPFTGAVAETQHGINARWLEPENFGAVGDGVADDTEAFIKLADAMIANGRKHCRATGTYLIFKQGATYSRSVLMQFSGLSGLCFDFSAATFIVDPAKSWTGSNAALIYLTNCNDTYAHFASITSPAIAVDGTFTGLQAVALHGDCRGLVMPYIRAVNLFTPLLLTDPVSTGSRGIEVGTIIASGCLYGVNGANSGSDMVIQNLVTDGCGRSMFMYGVSNVKARIRSKNHKYSADCVINAVTSGYQTISGFDIDYTNTETTSANGGHCVDVSHSFGDGVATSISDVRVQLNVKLQNGLGSAFQYTKVDGSGNPDTTDRGHALKGLYLSGLVDGTPDTGAQIQLGRNASVWGSGESVSEVNMEGLLLTGSTSASIDCKRIMPSLKGSLRLVGIDASNDIDVWGTGATSYAPSSTAARVVVDGVRSSNSDGYNSVTSVLGVNSVPGSVSPFAVLEGYSGLHISNQFATGAVTYNLPPAVIGLRYRFSRTAGFNMDLDPYGTEAFRDAAAGKYLRLGAVGAAVSFVCRSPGVWDIETAYGTTSFEP